MKQPSWELPSRVSDLMSRRLVTVSSGVDLAFAMQMMLWEGVRHLPVVDDGKLVGILSDRDFLPTSSDGTMREFLARAVGRVMSSEVKVVAPDAEVSVASALMATAHINALPVVEDDELVGIITSSDILAERGRLFFKVSEGKVPSVGDIMTDAPSVAYRDDALVEVATRMIDEGIRHLPVVDGDGVVIGMLAERDLRGVLGDLRSFLSEGGETLLDTQRVDDVMTHNPVTVTAEASLFDLASCYIDDRIGAVPVVDESDRLVGIASYIDLLAYLVKGR